MSKILESAICYLIGPIDFADDLGVGFRDEIKTKTEHLKIRYLDPCKKMAGLSDDVGVEQED